MPESRKMAAWRAVAYGLASAVLYFALFANAEQFTEWARRTRAGEKALFLLPIVVAFAFSYVHGTFTGYFWEALGLRPAEGSEKKRAATQSGVAAGPEDKRAGP